MSEESAISQTWDAGQYAQQGRFVADLAVDVFQLLDPQPGERILDLGCGDGALTARIAAAGADVIGVDSSPSMVDAARAMGLDARVANGDSLDFLDEFDAVFSNAALHWMPNQNAVLAGVRRALKPGGRFVAELGGYGNIAAIRVALAAVFASRGLDASLADNNFFPTAQKYSELLQTAGFQIEEIGLFPRPTALPGSGMRGWLEIFRRGLLDLLAAPDREQAIEEAVALLKPVLYCEESGWSADYVRLRFRARA